MKSRTRVEAGRARLPWELSQFFIESPKSAAITSDSSDTNDDHQSPRVANKPDSGSPDGHPTERKPKRRRIHPLPPPCLTDFPDLVQHIVKQVDSNKDLFQLALVAAIFVPFALEQLYRNVRLAISNTTLVYPPDPTLDSTFIHTAEREANLVVSLAVSTAGPLVRHLRVDDPATATRSGPTRPLRPDERCLRDIAVQTAVSRLTGLTRLEWCASAACPSRPLFDTIDRLERLVELSITWPDEAPPFRLPALDRLERLRIIDMHPRMKPESVSMLVRSARIRDLTLHWQDQDVGGREVVPIKLAGYFASPTQQGPVAVLEAIAIHNLVIHTHDARVGQLVETAESLSRLTLIGCAVVDTDGAVLSTDVFGTRDVVPKKLRSLRTDSRDDGFVVMLSRFSGLEELYLVNRPDPDDPVRDSPGEDSVKDDQTGPDSRPARFVANVGLHHGQSIRHLCLDRRWKLRSETLRQMAFSLPVLETISVSVDGGFSPEGPIRLLCGFYQELALRQIASYEQWQASVASQTDWETIPDPPVVRRTSGLTAVRLMMPPDKQFEEIFRSIPASVHMTAISRELRHPEYGSVDMFEIGGLAIELGGYRLDRLADSTANGPVRVDPDGSYDNPALRRQLSLTRPEQLAGIGIFAYDSIEVR